MISLGYILLPQKKINSKILILTYNSYQMFLNRLFTIKVLKVHYKVTISKEIYFILSKNFMIIYKPNYKFPKRYLLLLIS